MELQSLQEDGKNILTMFMFMDTVNLKKLFISNGLTFRVNIVTR